MKKVLMVLIVLFVSMPVTSAFAEDTNLLLNKTMNIGESLTGAPNAIGNTSKGVTTNITDTNMTTGYDILHNQMAWYEFAKPQDINAYLYSRGSGTDNTTFIRFYDENMNVLNTVNPAIVSVKNTIPTVQSVKYVGIYHNRGSGLGLIVKNLEIYGSESVIVSYDAVNNLLETHTDTTANLSWGNPPNASFSGVTIKKDGLEVAILENNISSYSISGLTAETSYNFEVVANFTDSSLTPTKSITVLTNSTPIDSTPPSNITNVQVVKSDTLASFLFSLPVDTDFSHLKIYRDGVLKETNFTGTSYDDFDLVQNTTYTYKFVSVDLLGNESNGFVQTVKTDITVDSLAPIAPTGVIITNGGSSGYVSWDKHSETDVLGYNVYLNGVKHNTSPVIATTYTIPNLTNDENYSITVTAVDTSGNESQPTSIYVLTPTSDAMPIFEAKYDLKDVADGTSQWFGSMWLILAFSVGIPLAFMIARRVKGLLIA